MTQKITSSWKIEFPSFQESINVQMKKLYLKYLIYFITGSN